MSGAQQMLLAAAGPLVAELPGSISNFSGSSPVTANATVTVRGGVGAKTFLWEWVSGPSPTAITIVSPTSQTTQLSAVLGPDESTGGTIRCTVTDASGSVQPTTTVNLSRTP